MPITTNNPNPSTLCEHLQPLLDQFLADGAKMTYVGTPWSRNCRTWVYLDRVLDLAKIHSQVCLAAVIQDHIHEGRHEGSEQGLVCTEHHDAIMGPLPRR